MSPVLSEFVVPVTSVHKVEADGVEVLYRAAGDPARRSECASAAFASRIPDIVVYVP